MEMPRIGRLGTGFKSFRPPVTLTLFLLSLAILFASLGMWQTKRAVEKQIVEEEYQQALELPLKTAISQKNRFSRISVNGVYDRKRHFLLDNQIWHGRAGVYVFTPFFTVDGSVILVNRGWLPLPPDRKTLPEIVTPKDQIILKGILNILPVPGKMLGAADKLDQNSWPQLLTYMHQGDLSQSLQQPLENWIVQLSQSAPTGFEGRDWKPVFLSSSRHRAYAFQWYALTLAAMIMWLYIGFRNPSGTKQ